MGDTASSRQFLKNYMRLFIKITGTLQGSFTLGCFLSQVMLFILCTWGHTCRWSVRVGGCREHGMEGGATSASPTPSRSDCPSIAKVDPRAMGLCQDCQSTCEGHSPQGVQPRAPISPHLPGSLYSLLKSPFKCHFFRESAIFQQSNCLLVTPAHSILNFPMIRLSQL